MKMSLIVDYESHVIHPILVIPSGHGYLQSLRNNVADYFGLLVFWFVFFFFRAFSDMRATEICETTIRNLPDALHNTQF